MDLGAGVGTAGLALAHRVPKLDVALVEIDPVLADLARENAVRNALADRVRVATLDVTASAQDFAGAGLPPEWARHVLMNPPFNDAARQNASPDARRTCPVSGSGKRYHLIFGEIRTPPRRLADVGLEPAAHPRVGQRRATSSTSCG